MQRSIRIKPDFVNNVKEEFLEEKKDRPSRIGREEMLSPKDVEELKTKFRESDRRNREHEELWKKYSE